MSADKRVTKPIKVAGFTLSGENALKAAIFIRKWQQINSEKFNPTRFKVGVIERFLMNPERSKEKTRDDKASIFEQAGTLFHIKDESDPRFNYFLDVAEVILIGADVEMDQERPEDEDLRDTFRVIRKIILSSQEIQHSFFQQKQIDILFDAPLYKKYSEMVRRLGLDETLIEEKEKLELSTTRTHSHSAADMTKTVTKTGTRRVETTQPADQSQHRTILASVESKQAPDSSQSIHKHELSIQEQNIVALYVRGYAKSEARFRHVLRNFFKDPESNYETVKEVFKKYQKMPGFQGAYNALSSFLQSAANIYIQGSRANAELHFTEIRAKIEEEIAKVRDSETRREVVHLPEIVYDPKREPTTEDNLQAPERSARSEMDRARYSPLFDSVDSRDSLPGPGRSDTSAKVDSRTTTDVDSGSDRSSPETTTPGSSPESQRILKPFPPGKPTASK